MNIIRNINFENKIKLITLISASILVLIISNWPESFVFATPSNLTISERLFNTPFHLSDDVMIGHRAGYMIDKIGIPSHNIDDLSQPSTSYFAPYLYYFLNKFLPTNLSTIAYAFLGYLCTIFTFGIIIFNSKSIINAQLIILSFVISSTSINFTLNGWDHLFQTFFLVLSIYFLLKDKHSKITLILIGLSLSSAFLWRPDSAIFALSTLFILFFKQLSSKRLGKFLYTFIPFISIILPFLTKNYLSFGYLTPTTARLKIGASPSLNFAFNYLFKNSILDFSVITIFIILISIYIFYLRKKSTKEINITILSIILVCVIAAINSDAFAGGRMFWAPTFVLSFIICKIAPPIINNENEFLKFNIKIFKPFNKSDILKNFLIYISIVSIFFSTIKTLKTQFLDQAITSASISSSEAASQFVLAKWIEKNLNPKDGPIGFTHLGVSFHLSDYSIADFLGKADEEIAQSEVKFGAPGHNKWDINTTLDKWNPQAIVSPVSIRFIDQKYINNAKFKLENKKDESNFYESFYGNKRILKNYSFCFTKNNEKKISDIWGLLIRNDILENKDINSTCARFN